MPTAEEYRDAAIDLRRVDARLAHEWTLVRLGTTPHDLAGGPIATSVERQLDSARAGLHRAGSELARLALICDRRAEICTGFTAELLRYRRLVTTIGFSTSPPPAPVWWAEP